MNIWLRNNSFQHCSWRTVWMYLRDAFIKQGTKLYTEQDVPPDYPGEFVELWWGDPGQWEWSKEGVACRVGIAVSENPSFLVSSKDRAIENVQLCDLLICPSAFSARAYLEAPIEVPIEVVMFGVDTDEIRFCKRDWSKRTNFTFLMAGAAQFRKGSWIGIEAFLKAFDKRSNARLLVWSSMQHRDFLALQNEYGGQSKITFDDSNVSSPVEIYQRAHVLVSPHLSEGFGLCIPEAMSTGMPCLVSRCSSPREYFDKEFGWWIEMSDDYVPVQGCLPSTRGFWRLPDVDSLVRAMRSAYAERDICQQKGAAAASYVRNNLTWDGTVHGIAAKISNILYDKQLRPLKSTEVAV